MRRLFGWGKEEEAPKKDAQPTLQQAADRIDQQVQALEEKIAKSDEEIRQLVAKGSTNPTAKARAMQAMKRKKMYEQNRDQLLGQQFNVENLAFQQEQAEVTAMAVQAMSAGTEQLKEQQKNVNINTVDKLTEDLADVQDEMKAINEALAQSSVVPDGADQETLDEEYARLEEEMAAMALAGGTPAATPAAAAVPAGYASASTAPSAPQPVPSAVPSAPP
mmetsp:Transcript_38991/g.70395  ORF Transcript_38991/g.70395 Transcript_38991/m.70395 type:complete len:220 (+) Transcript_38991:57-716(+)|eukprot:CAMPEP_0197641496 /NCGR_PEP_ID=MMETSP1338-20131121/15450_1 /TAXON_ID=43686 ORGANISM="Pelagodinium beii, Strain RCC1491" /NCGR_SAMPLE_ID=MMETSP1338 /ASSEMBLY_ACC=CAM_ASM_000754 /LENGTH=219 /DNA_ID=CAMNT_0043214497 /DNA_START=57 /DNA_END=716 /DNA_ORIENTATION=-